MKVDIIIIGAQKCGTTALHSFLNQHPKIIGSNPKELEFFNSALYSTKGTRYYHSFFSPKPVLSKYRGYRFMESSPAYSSAKDCAEIAKRIFRYNKNVKIISLVRNPVDRAYSAWNMYKKRVESGDADWWVNYVVNKTGSVPELVVRRSREEYSDFTLYIENELKAVNLGARIEASVLPQGYYHYAIEQYRAVFGEQYQVIKNEDLMNNTPGELSKLTQFLDLLQHDWSMLKGERVFEGQYENKIESSIRMKLEEFYKAANEKLHDLTGISY